MSLKPPIRFTCPSCDRSHTRGYLDGVGVFRCLGCGETSMKSAEVSVYVDLADTPRSSEPSPAPRGWSPSSDPLYESHGAGAIPHSASDFRPVYGESPLDAIVPVMRRAMRLEDILR